MGQSDAVDPDTDPDTDRDADLATESETGEPLCDRARRLGAGDGDRHAADRARSDARSGAGAHPVGRTGLDPASALEHEERHHQIVVLLRRALAHGEPSAPGLLASAHLERGDRLSAAEVLVPVVHTQGRDDLAGVLGEILTELGDHEAAEAAFLLGLDAADPGAMNGYGLFLWGRGRTQEAAYVLDRAARAGDELAPLNLVTLHLEELDDAVGAAIVAQEFHDESRPATVVALADVRLADGRLEEAETLYRRATELGAACAHIYYGWFLQDRRDDVEGAEEQLRRAYEIGELRSAYHLGRFLLDTGRFDEARPHIEEASFAGDTDAEAVLDAEYRGTFDPWDD